MSIELYTVDGDDQIEEVIAVLRFALGAAEESEIIHPETVTALRKWCSAEWGRLHPPAPRITPEQEVRAALQRSPYFPFWSALQAGDEVRWTGTKNATYFVVDPEWTDDPGSPIQRHTAYIELRRHSGKTFWTHVGKVRPL